MSAGWIAGAAEAVAQLVFPPVCVACRTAVRRPREMVCDLCWSRSAVLPAPRCGRCWSPTADPGARSCGVCREFPPGLRSVRSAFLMRDPVRQMVHALKYGGWEAVADPLARRIAALSFPPDVHEEARIVLPVPASPMRLRERGYNQAERISAAFAHRTGRLHNPALLLRSRSGGTQTALHPAERRANVAAAFNVSAPSAAAVRDQHLLLVDDVWTTGATAVECANVLLAAGARAVSVVTFARALPQLER